MQISCITSLAHLVLEAMEFLRLNVILSVSICPFLLISSCKDKNEVSGAATVEWPELTRLDNVAYRADGLVRTGDTTSVRASLAELLETGRAVTPATIPFNAVARQQVETLMADLANLIEELSSEELGDESLSSLVLGLHPVIEKLIEAAGMPHLHGNEGPHDGFLHPIFGAGGGQVGTAEIKLHDDAGDLEIWLTQGGYDGTPWRLPLDAVLTLKFPDLGKELSLAVRDRETNKDESGNSTIHDGGTSYFVFPGESGRDATWLKGADFAAKANLAFQDGTTGLFTLRPHVHKDGH